FLPVHLVVEGQKLKLLAVEAAARIDRVDVELVRFLRQNAGGGASAGQRIDEGDLDVRRRRAGKARNRDAQPDDVTRGSAHGSSCWRRGSVRRTWAGPGRYMRMLARRVHGYKPSRHAAVQHDRQPQDIRRSPCKA